MRRLAENPSDIRSNNSPTAPRRLKAMQRRQFVVALRVAGASLRQCADQAIKHFGEENLPKNYNSRTVWRDIDRAQKLAYQKIADDLETFRMIQVDRYEHLVRAHWPKAMAGLFGATDRVLKAMKDENALLGLNAPDRRDVRMLHIDARIDELMEAAAARRVEAMAARQQVEVAGALGSGRESPEDSIVEGTARHL